MKLLKEGRLFQQIPFTAMRPSQDLKQGLLFFTRPDLCQDGIPQTALQGLDPQVAIDQDEGVGSLSHDNHRQDLPKTLDGMGQGKDLVWPLDPGMGVLKPKLCDLDFFDFSNRSGIHDRLTLDGGIDQRSDPCIHKNGTSRSDQPMP
jgi:hypothetical protein